MFSIVKSKEGNVFYPTKCLLTTAGSLKHGLSTLHLRVAKR